MKENLTVQIQCEAPLETGRGCIDETLSDFIERLLQERNVPRDNIMIVCKPFLCPRKKGKREGVCDRRITLNILNPPDSL